MQDYFKSLLLFSGILLLFSCATNEEEKRVESPLDSEKKFVEVMSKHLDAVTNKDLDALKSTMSPSGKMQLIVPSSEIINTVDSFMNYHEEWFAVPSWTFETRILNKEVGERFGMAITEIIYREKERDGMPYFNRMIVSYVLEKENNEWFIIKDHASSVEKSTDVEKT